MDKTKLVEIRKGEEGTGLLIEHDGYISSDCGSNRKLFEDINAQDGDDFHCPRHFVVDAVFQKYGMGCLGCAAARFENLEAGAKVHGFDPDQMCADINALIEE